MDATVYASGTGYFIDIITTYHKHIRSCIAMIPHHMRAIEHHEAFIYHGDDHCRMAIREQMLQPTLHYSLHNLDNPSSRKGARSEHPQSLKATTQPRKPRSRREPRGAIAVQSRQRPRSREAAKLRSHIKLYRARGNSLSRNRLLLLLLRGRYIPVHWRDNAASPHCPHPAASFLVFHYMQCHSALDRLDIMPTPGNSDTQLT